MVAFRLVIGETSQHITGPRCSYMQDKSEKCGSVIWKFFLSRSGNAYFLPLFWLAPHILDRRMSQSITKAERLPIWSKRLAPYPISLCNCQFE